ncbi:hypothetical protein ONZ45_g19299 [Pleurotus djamor]|nr:hypothetical protein ONZ45_g19299 [Pleurotus djamor]
MQRSTAAKLTAEAEDLFKDVELWVQLTERINEKRATLGNDIHAAAGILTGSGGDAQALAAVPDDLAAAIEGCFADAASQETLQSHLTTVREVTDKLVKSLPSPKKIPKAPSTQKPKIPRRTSKAKSKDSHGITEKRTYKIATSYSSSKDIPTPKGRHVYQVKGNQRPRPKPQGQNSTDSLPRSRNTVP